mgnify:CR=1 FL=1
MEAGEDNREEAPGHRRQHDRHKGNGKGETLVHTVEYLKSANIDSVGVSFPLRVNGEIVGGVSVFNDMSKYVSLVSKLQKTKEMNKYLEDCLGDPMLQKWSKEFITVNPHMKKVLELAMRVAQSEATVLIRGESGTGKEVMASLIHHNSQKADGPFVKVNCAAIPDNLLESELFGYEGGAFTGARKEGKAGKFELAQNGTIFLDEIGDMPADLQTRLLRVLSDGYFYRVGGTQSIKADVRVIAATNQNLEERVRQGLFREDLYHRLNVIHLQLPPLRERTEDIEALADHFLSTAASNLKTERKRLTPEALQVIRRFPFPGNVRQLENLCNWLTVMAPSQWIRPDDLPFEFKTGSGQAASEAASDVIATRAGGWTDQLAEVVRELLSRVRPRPWMNLTVCLKRRSTRPLWNLRTEKTIEAAQKLGVGRNTLTRKLQELGLR